MYLNCKTRFSFLYGTVETEELVKTAVEVGANAIVLTNINSTCDVWDLLEETYGVMVYQEDVIKVAHHFAGLDMAEADVLRRAMSGKSRGHKQFKQIREKYFRLCKEKNILAR